MLTGAPRNSEYLELFVSPAFAQVTTFNGMSVNPRRVEVLLDVNLLNCTSLGQGSVLLFGKETAGWNWGFDDAQPTTLACVARFTSIRNAVTKTSTTTFTYGERSLLFGVDDGATVKARSDGVEPVASSTWTAAQGTKPLSVDANPLTLGVDGSIYTHLRLYELWVRVNGIVTCHVRPKRLYAGLAAIPDLSGMGNDLTLSGTEGTDYRFGTAWAKEVPFAGSEALL